MKRQILTWWKKRRVKGILVANPRRGGYFYVKIPKVGIVELYSNEFEYLD